MGAPRRDGDGASREPTHIVTAPLEPGTGSLPRPSGPHAEQHDVRESLARDRDLPAERVAELLGLDQCERWGRGERVPAEAYLQLHPGLQDGGGEPAFTLIYGEFLLREAAGEPPTPEEFCWRFPRHADRLRRQLALHRTLRDAEDGEPDRALDAEVRGGPGDGPATPRPSSWPRLPDLVIEADLGRGGMGVVYRARHARLGRTVAVKMIRADELAGPEAVARFDHEARAIARLRHPNVVQVYGVGDHDGRPYIEMEYLEGGNLRQALDGTPRPPVAAARLVETLARALGELHRLGMVHRDLKPANILLTADGTPKIADFGLAKLLDTDSHLTRTESIVGSPSYMAPEQAGGTSGAVGTSADIYALGAILYELLCGRPPFHGASVLQTLELVRTAEPVSPSRLVPGLPRDLVTIVAKCLQKDPAKRYESSGALAEDLGRFLAGEPVRARRASATERAWRRCRRSPVVAGLAAAFVLAVVVGFALVVWQWGRAVRAREEALAARREAILTLADMHTQGGLVAGDRGASGEAPLWFAEAARLARDDPDRARSNRIRAGAWGRLAAVPVWADRLDGGEVVELDLDAGGRYLLAYTGPGRRALWDLAEGRPLPWLDGSGRPGPARLSPDGRLVALGMDSGVVELRRVPGGEPAGQFEIPGPVRSLAFTPDGRRLAAGGDAVRVWDCSTGRFSGPGWPHPRPVYGLSFDRAGGRLATVALDDAARLFDVEGGGPASPPLPSGSYHWKQPYLRPAAIFADGGRALVTASGRREVSWWDAATGRRIRSRVFPGRTIVSLAASADGRRLVAAGLNTAQVWDAATGDPVGPALDQPDGVHSARFRPDGSELITACFDHLVRRWSLPEGRPVGPPIRTFSGFLATYTPNGRAVVTTEADGISDGLVCLWRLPDDAGVRRLGTGPGGPAAARLDPTGRYVVAGLRGAYKPSRPGAVVYDLASSRPIGPTFAAGGPIRDAALSPGARVAATLTEAKRDGWGEVALWEPRTGSPLGPPVPMPSPAWTLAFSPDGTRLAAICRTGELPLIDAATGRIVRTLRHERAERAELERRAPVELGLAFAPDGAALASFGPDATVQVWDVAAGRRRFPPLRVGCRGFDLKFSPDGRHLALAALDGTLRIWDAATGRPAAAPLRHPDWVLALAFGPDGRTVATGCRDGQARLWDWRAGTLVCPPFGHGNDVYDLALTPDGLHLATSALDGRIRFWEHRTGKPLTPALPVGAVVLSLAVTPDGHFAVAGTAGPEAIAVLGLEALLGPPPLDSEGLVTLGELTAGARLQGGSLAGLTPDEWLAEYRRFVGRHPAFARDQRSQSIRPRNPSE